MPAPIRGRSPRVAILGARWGRTHVGTFRAAGCEVIAIVGADPARSREVAAVEGVFGSSLGDVGSADVVVVATPVESHARLVEAFADKHVLCEKPLAGAASLDPRAEVAARSHVWVNYAMPFLATAREVARLVRAGRIGPPARARVRVWTRIPGGAAEPDLREHMDVAVHPLAFLRTLVGPMVRRSEPAAGATATLEAGACAVHLELGARERPGITVALGLEGAVGSVALEGSWEPGRTWSWGPALLDGAPVTSTEARDDGDVWYDANCRAVARFVDVVRGQATAADATGDGLLDGATALELERGVADLF